MSIIRTVVRLATVAALRERTWAQSRVYDSNNTPLLDALLGQGSQPYITVFTEDDVRSGISGKDIQASPRSLALVMEIGIALASSGLAPEDVEISIPPTDEGMELTMDIVESQALGVIFGEPSSVWGEILRRIFGTISRVSSARGGAAERGARWAARQLVITSEHILSDPVGGTVLPANHPVRTFVTAGRASSDPNMVGAANIVNDLINDTPVIDWLQAQAWLGLNRGAAQGMGIAPFERGDDTAATTTQVRDFHPDSDIRPYNDFEHPLPEFVYDIEGTAKGTAKGDVTVNGVGSSA